jgi:hypothetical protein
MNFHDQSQPQALRNTLTRVKRTKVYGDVKQPPSLKPFHWWSCKLQAGIEDEQDPDLEEHEHTCGAVPLNKQVHVHNHGCHLLFFWVNYHAHISIKLTRTTPQGASFKVQCAFSCMFWSSEFSSPHFWRKANDLTGRSCFSPAKTWKRKHETGFSGQLASNMRPKEPLNGVVN